jgi:ketosteroid isomerase-like protein
MARFVLPLAACVALSGCTAAPVDTTRIAETVKGEIHQLVAEYNAHDAAKAASHDAPGYVSMFHGGPNAIGPAADKAVMEAQMKDANVKFEVTDEAVDVAASGDLAVYRGSYTYTLTDPETKALMTEKGNWVVALKPQADGAWKLIWSIGADTGPIAPVTIAG